MEKIIVAPSVLAADFMNLEKDIKKINNSNAKWVHLDIMDGNFVPNISFGFDIISQIRECTDKVLDVHLMIQKPSQYIDKVISAGADIIVFHIEVNDNISDNIKTIKANNKKVGLAVNPDTDIEQLVEYLPQIDLVLIMSVFPGFGGQSYIKDVERKINFLKQYKEEKHLNFLIEVDGGINKETAVSAKSSGANVLVAGSYLFSEGFNEKVDELIG